MAGSSADDYDVGGSSSSFIEGMLNEERCPSVDSLADSGQASRSRMGCPSVDSLAEWRSSEHVENGMPSTLPPYWDTDDDDDDDDDGGLKPSDLYGKFTWKIENFSQLNKRELRSSAFEVGGYKWHVLIYPQGCDVSNHLSLFLCISQHEKLLPGWGHFAQFTIAVVNKDYKKSMYSDALHRFWKKEHDWGWKKFIELSKVSDGFVVADTLVIKVQVQVIREKANRPFRCLDRHYRRELVRIYLSNVEQICRRFVEERRGKLSKLIEDKMRWSSFRDSWLGIDQCARRRMSRDKTDSILKVVVKQFFVDKEVTSTLVMDSLYSGLKALECQSKDKKEKERLVDMEELPAPMVLVEKDMFVLADDVLLLLERLAQEPLPHQLSSPKDDKGLQNRTKDETSGEELNKDIMRDERCLTELGRRTVEIFVLGHIFSNNIEAAYKEAVALKRQEELIREEEAAGQVENELKAKRNAAEKDKRAKKKQAKQKKSTRKGKDKGRDEKSYVIMLDNQEVERPSDRSLPEEFSRQTQPVNEKIDKSGDISNVPDTGDDVNWDIEIPETRPTIEVSSTEKHVQIEQMSRLIIDDTCSTCLTDSVPSVATNGPYNGYSLAYNKKQVLPVRGKNHRSRDIHDRNGSTHDGNNPSSDGFTGATHYDETDSFKNSQCEPVAVVFSKDHIESLDRHLVKKEVQSLQKSLNVADQVEVEKPRNLANPWKKPQFDSQAAKRFSENPRHVPASSKELPIINPAQTEKLTLPATKSVQVSSSSKSDALKMVVSARSPVTHKVPIIPPPRPTVVSTPLLSRSVSAAGRISIDSSPSLPSFVHQSYRNAISSKTGSGKTGTTGTGAPTGFAPAISLASSSQAVTNSQPSSAFLSPASMLLPQTSSKNGPSTLEPGFTFGSVKPETLRHPWKEEHYSHQEAGISGALNVSNIGTDTSRLEIHGGPLEKPYPGEASSSAPSVPAQGTMSEEFPHLGIINDLLDEDQGIYRAADGRHYSFNRQYTFPRDVGSVGDPGRFNPNEHYYGEGFQRVYGSSNGLRDARHRQMDIFYGNGQIDGVTQNQWPYHRAEPTMANLGGVDASGYPYQLQDYLNSPSGENGGYMENGGYNMYRSS